MLTGARKTQRRTSALTLLEQYRQDGDEFLTHIVKADEIWVWFWTTKLRGSQNSGFIHIYQTDRKILNENFLLEN